jgi:hypothetical protein
LAVNWLQFVEDERHAQGGLNTSTATTAEPLPLRGFSRGRT